MERKGGYNNLCDIWAVGITAIELAELQPPMFDLHPMRALFLMSKSNFKPPTLKGRPRHCAAALHACADKNKWSLVFQDFVKTALRKNPRKRPDSQQLLAHQFVGGVLTRELTRDLLRQVRSAAGADCSGVAGERRGAGARLGPREPVAGGQQQQRRGRGGAREESVGRHRG